MMEAKYYIYRNLHTQTFSVRYKGKVIAHPRWFTAYNVTLKVNEKGRQNVIDNRRKQVHAFVVCDSWVPTTRNTKMVDKLFYDPYKSKSFMDKSAKCVTSTPVVIGCFGRLIFTAAYKNKRSHDGYY